MFVGWEGSFMICPKWLSQSDYSILSFMFFVHTSRQGTEAQKRFFFSAAAARDSSAASHLAGDANSLEGDGYKPFFLFFLSILLYNKKDGGRGPHAFYIYKKDKKDGSYATKKARRNFNNYPISGITNSLNILQDPGGVQQQKRSFHNKVMSHERIGPHNLDAISLIIGSLLSNSYLEKRESGLGIRVVFIKFSNNVEYLIKVYSMLARAGYCNFNRPRLYKLIGKGNEVFFLLSFKTYSFSTRHFNWIYDLFCPPRTPPFLCFNGDGLENNPRIFSEQNLYNLLTPLALATIFISSIWVEEKAALSIIQTRFKAEFASVEYKQLVNISHVLKLKYDIETEINNNCRPTLWPAAQRAKAGTLLIKTSSRAVFTEVVKAHILPSQYHFFKSPNLKLIFGTLCAKRGLVTMSPARLPASSCGAA